MLQDSCLKDGTVTADLVESAIAGNPQCREQLFTILVTLFKRLAVRACDKFGIRADRETVEDLVGDLVHHFLDDSRGECWRIARWLGNQVAPFEHYATAVASRLLVTQMMTLNRRNVREVPLNEDLAGMPSSEGQDGLSGEVRECMAMLPQDYQDVLYLRYEEGLSGAEISRLMGRTPNAAYQLLHRAKAELRRLVTEATDDGARDLV